MKEDDETQDVWEPENPTDFKVYDVPMELKNDYISMAKLHYDDDVWKVMADAMAALKEDKFTRVDVLENKVSQLEEQIQTMKQMLKAFSEPEEDDEDDLKPTLGGARE